MNESDNPARATGRRTLIGVAAIFLAPFLVAVVLHRMDYRPAQTRNRGELLQPPVALAAFHVRLETDARVAWQNERDTWTLVVRVPQECAPACWESVGELTRLRTSLGRFAPRLELLMLDAMPPMERRAALAPMRFGAMADGVPAALATPPAAPAVWLADPRGYLVLAYAPGYALADLSKDLKRLIR